jgi:two-component system, OmpR family, phosphate regulon sensor histidine kinase PhoR
MDPMAGGLVAGSDDQNRGFRRIVYLLIWLVIVPTALLLIMGILMLVFWEAQLNLLFGILSIGLVGCMVTGGVLSLVYLRREANLSKLQLDFVSKVSHELRTPLTSIRMFVEMLQADDGRDPNETAICLDVLQKETIRLSQRIERLLDWGRMESGRRVYELEPETSDAIVEAALSAFDATQVGHVHDIEAKIDEGVMVSADRAALVDALVNLLSNAVKYGGGESTRIVIAAESDARHLRLSVSDNGIGIPKREHKNIFQKFYRANDLLSRDVEGSGLGLAIVRHVAQGHGGRVEVDSEPGRGSTFTIVIPRPLDDELARLPEERREQAA